jgi:beta-N-acetylhexosaminidase
LTTDRLQRAPFFLDSAGVDWVESTLDRMSVDEKIGQVFCLVSYGVDEESARYVTRDLRAGGVMCRPGPLEEIVGTVSLMQTGSDIPMLMAGNLETGGDGLCLEGTRIGSPMAIAATGDIDLAYRLGVACGREATALGVNWAFAPVADIDLNFRNPITNTRTFGANAGRVAAMAAAAVRGIQENGVAATVKHFPGDGVDERDQHLVTTINSLSCEDWDDTYGLVYRTCIAAGVKAVMVGHIALPAYSRRLRPGIDDEDILPASLAYEIATTLLREKLGFNGLVVTDATVMAGMVMAMERSKAVPGAIAAGCDVFLFTRNLEEDVRCMREGVANGLLTEERLTEAVRNVLALKASLRLHEKKAGRGLVPTVEAARTGLATGEHRAWARECADRSITLVKEEQGVLPLSPATTRRVLVYGLEPDEDYFGFREEKRPGAGVGQRLGRLLEHEGFTVELFLVPDRPEGRMVPYQKYVDDYDLMLYVANMDTKSNQTVVRIKWSPPMGADVPIYFKAIPTVFVSVANPYHLLDVPRVRTYINTYGLSDVVLEALVDKLMGRSPFKGASPVDPFCGRWDARL